MIAQSGSGVVASIHLNGNGQHLSDPRLNGRHLNEQHLNGHDGRHLERHLPDPSMSTNNWSNPPYDSLSDPTHLNSRLAFGGKSKGLRGRRGRDGEDGVGRSDSDSDSNDDDDGEGDEGHEGEGEDDDDEEDEPNPHPHPIKSTPTPTAPLQWQQDPRYPYKQGASHSHSQSQSQSQHSQHPHSLSTTQTPTQMQTQMQMQKRGTSSPTLAPIHPTQTHHTQNLNAPNVPGRKPLRSALLNGNGKGERSGKNLNVNGGHGGQGGQGNGKPSNTSSNTVEMGSDGSGRKMDPDLSLGSVSVTGFNTHSSAHTGNTGNTGNGSNTANTGITGNGQPSKVPGGRKPTCDICRKRKIKCVRPTPPPRPSSSSSHPNPNLNSNSNPNAETDPTEDPTQTPCTGCTAIGLECTYHHVYKRPGRPNSWITGDRGVKVEIGSTGGQGQGQAGTTQGQGQGQGTNGPSQSSRKEKGEKRKFNGDDGGRMKVAFDTGLVGMESSGFWMTSPDLNVYNGGMEGNGGWHSANGTVVNPGLKHRESFVSDFSTGGNGARHMSLDYGQGGRQDGVASTAGYVHPGITSGENALEMNVGSGPLSNGMEEFNSPQYRAVQFTPRSLGGNAVPLSTTATTGDQFRGEDRPRTASFSTGQPSSSIPPMKLLQDSLNTMPQIEDVTSWSTVSFFISLYLRHLHALTPIVHKPNFTVCLATRLDHKDVEFRAFLLSLTSYVISQSPKSRMIEHYTQSELEKLQNTCYRASQLLQRRRYKEPNLIQVGTLLCDYFFCASTGKVARATATMAEAIALAYRMNMHDDVRTASTGVDHTEIQLRRRTFWHLYAIDKTEASSGTPSMMNDHEGLCSLPLEVDDDFITAQGSFPQPPQRTSIMVGFVAVSKLFKIMSEVLFRHRCVQARFNLSSVWESDPLPGESGQSDMESIIVRESEWIVRAHDRIREVLDGLPPDLATQRGESGMGTIDPRGLSPDSSAIFGMQVANCLITAASVQFALYDFKAFLDAGADTVAESQEQTAREMYRLLSSIPLDHLAANGESMRGKVLRIILALLNRSRTPDQLSEEVKSFWNMFSMIQFVQVMPSTTESVFPSREPSPGRTTMST